MIQLSMACKKCRFLRQQGAKAIFFSWGSVFLGIAGTPRNSYCIFSKYENNSLWSYVLRARRRAPLLRPAPGRRRAGGPWQRQRQAPAALGRGEGGARAPGIWCLLTENCLVEMTCKQYVARGTSRPEVDGTNAKLAEGAGFATLANILLIKFGP